MHRGRSRQSGAFYSNPILRAKKQRSLQAKRSQNQSQSHRQKLGAAQRATQSRWRKKINSVPAKKRHYSNARSVTAGGGLVYTYVSLFFFAGDALNL